MLKRAPTRLAALAIIAAFTACADAGTGPDRAFELDTERASEDYDALSAAFSGPELTSLAALGGRTPFSGTAGAALVSLAENETPVQSDGGRAFAVGLTRRIRAAQSVDSPPAAPIISESHRGSTFVYDPDSDEYVIDPERDDAPATGVRFVLYEVDASGAPMVEAVIGHADLVDEGDESAEDVALRLVVVIGERTALEYATTLDFTFGRVELGVAGFLQGDDVRVDFEIDVLGTDDAGVETLDVDWDIAVEARSFHLSGSVSGIREDGEGAAAISVDIRHGDASLEVAVEVVDGMLDGSVHVDGELFATVTGPEDDPTFAGEGGRPLSLRELHVLGSIFHVVEDVFDFLEDLVDPVDDLILLGIVL